MIKLLHCMHDERPRLSVRRWSHQDVELVEIAVDKPPGSQVGSHVHQL